MLRGICLVVGAGLLLVACSGDSKKNQGTPEPDPNVCEGGCGSDEVCSDGECLPVCSSSSSCDDGEACREGACHTIVCGDGFEEGDEECDNGERNDDDAVCTSACLDAVCGDGLIRIGREECDDGADNADDGACTEACTEATCGDGLVWSGEEECDEGASNADDAACTNACVAARCGDGLVWADQEECDDGNQNLNDTCPDGPEGTCQVAPEPATALGWQQGSHTSSLNPVAIWTPSPAADRMVQELQLFSDDSCSMASGTPIALPSASTAMLQLPVSGEGSYTFRIITRDSAQRQSTSECSPALVVDTTAPQPATGLGFLESSPHDSLTVHGTWTRSPSTDLGSQSIQLYGGGVCAVTLGNPTLVMPVTAEQYPIVTPSNASYSYKVITADLAGNTAVSACSPAMQTAGGMPYTAVFKGLPQTIFQVRIDPKNASILYATLSSGEVHKSVNAGSSWTRQCKSTNIASFGGNYGHIKVSPDGTAYATGHTQFARVEALNGAECPIAISNSAAWASYFHSNRLAITSTGKLYTWTFTDPEGLVSSLDKGVSYDLINVIPSLFNSLEVDPFDDDHLVGVFSLHSTSPEGIHHSLNGGLNWTQTDATFTDYQGGIRFNPAAEGWIYMGGGHYSDDGGLTWTTNATFDCLEVDAAGAGYRLTTGVGTTHLQRAADMTSPIWSTLHTFTGVEANLGVSMVSVVGATIAVVLEGRLYVSSNAGSTFTPVTFPSTEGSLVASSIVAHGSLLYAAANGRIYKSTDAAQNWAEAYAPASALDAETELHLNPGVPDQLLARPESWNSTYEERVDLTLDGGASWSSTTDCCYGWAGVLALGAADAGRVYYFGYQPKISINGGLSFTDSTSDGDLVWYPWPAAFISPANSSVAWYGDDGGRLVEFNQAASTDTNITSRLPFTTPAGMDLVKVGNVWQLRVISRTGQIAVSTDDGASFALVPGSGGLPAVDQRIFVSHPDTPSLIATAPLLGGDIAYSPTLGASWVQTNVDNCEVRSLALTDGQLLMACDGSNAMGMAAP
jgi:hypothetical protein